jgi:TP901 family phage tail tape measure protein
LADVNSNININFNTDAALAQLRQLQAGLSKFHQSLAEGNLAAANAQKGLNAQLLQSIGATGKFSASQVKVAGSTLAFTSALEKNKLSLREYFRYTMAAATANTRVLGKAFAEEREIINRARRDRVKALQTQYVQLSKSNAGFMEAIKIMPKSLVMASGKFTELGTRIQYAAQRQQFLNQLLKQGSTQLLNFGKNTQWAGRQLMVGLTMPLALFGASAAKAFKELDAEIVKFRRVYGDAFTNDAEVEVAVQNIRRLATEYTKYGVSVTKTMEMAATAAAAGFKGDALSAQVETATKLAVLGQVEQQQALETTISLQSAFGISSEELAKKIDFLNAVENQTLLSIEDLTIAIPKAAPVIKQLGGNVEDLAFFLTAMKEGGINASEGANALKSGLASLINPSDKAAKFLGNMGINIKGLVEANKGDIKGIVVGFAQALDTLDPLNRARAIEQMFGKFQFARLSTLFQNVTKDGSQASRAFDLAGKSVEELAILSEREMKKIEDSVGVKFQAAIENFKQEIMPLGKAFLEALTPIVKFFGGLFERFNSLGDNTKKVIAIIVGAVAGLGPVLLMTFGLLMNGVANVIKLFAMLRGGIAKLNGQTSVLGGGFNYMTQEQIENAASSQQLHQTHTRLIEVFNVEAASVGALASSYNALSTQMRTMASQNPALFAGGAPGAKRAVSKLPPVKKYQEGVLSVPGPKGAGDVVPAMLSPGEAVIPTKTTNKYRGLISAMFQDKVPGFMAGRLPGGAGKTTSIASKSKAAKVSAQAKKNQSYGYDEPHPERKVGPAFVGTPKSFEEASQSRQILDRISQQVSLGRFGTLPPTNFGTMLQSFSGRSFPARGVGGVYRKPNGKVVVVKPTIDEKTALAEIRATEIAREVHGLVSPTQSIRTMIDPTDPTGQRKFIVIESPYDSRISNMSGKFSKSDMVKQLVASTLRGDKDLQQPNLSGNVLADVGTAGVFDRASGFRDFAKAMPSMEEQAVVNLLGVKGGAKKFFAQETSGLAASMSPLQYDTAIKKEISQSIPKLKNLIKSWDGDLDPEEKLVYGKMLERLEAGKKVNWDQLQPMHARAGDGVKKLKVGNLENFKNVPETKTQTDKLVKKLNKDIENTLKELKTTNPQQYKKAIALLEKSGVVPKANGAINFKESKVYSDFIAKHLVYKDGVFHTSKAIEKGQSPTTSGKSYDTIKNQLLYRMGAAPKPGKTTFSNKPFVPSRLHEDLTSTTKSGGWRANIEKGTDLYEALDKAEMEHKARNIANPKNVALNNLRSQMITDGYTVKQIDDMLRTELSHISKTGEAGLGPEKWKKGFAKFDLRLLNSYVNPGGKPGKPVENPRLAKILKWNANNNNALFNPEQTAELKKALEFIKIGAHPITESQARLVQAAANAQVEADRYLTQYKEKNSGAKPKGFPDLGSVRQAKAVSTLLSDRLGGGYYQGTPTIYRLGPGSVLAQPGEYLADLEKETADKLSVGNTQSRPMGAKPSTGITSDNLMVEETQTKRVVTKDQAQKGGFKMRAKNAGDPSVKLTPYQRQELKKIKAKNPDMDETQAKDLLRRKLKNDRDILKSKEKEAAAARKEAKRAELLPKQIAAEKAKADKIESEIRKKQTELRQAEYEEEKRVAKLIAEENKQIAEDKKKETAIQKKQLRQEKVGRVSGAASMGLGTVGMGLMMAGQQNAGMAVSGAAAIAGMAPMFAGMGPVGLAVTGLIAAGGSLFLLNKHLKDSAKKQAEYVRSISATTEKMQSVGEITNKVGASELAAKRREGGLSQKYNESAREGSGFGQKFLTSEIGKSIQNAFSSNMAKKGVKVAAEDLALELSTYISDGIITAEDAKSIAYQIGVNLEDSTLTTNIQGSLRMLVGPNGENLLKDPLQARMRIVSIADARSQRTVQEMISAQAAGNSGRTEAAQLAAYSSNTIQIAQAQADAISIYAEKQKKILESELLATKNKERQLAIQKELTSLVDMQVTANAKVAAQIANAVTNFETARDAGNAGAFFNASDADVKAKYKGTSYSAAAQRVLDKAAAFDAGGMGIDVTDSIKKGQALEAKVQFIMASGVMNPSQMEAMIKIFAGDLNSMDVALNVGIRKQGGAKTGELTALLNGVGTESAQRIILSTVRKDPEEFDKITNALALLQASDGYEISMSAYLETNGLEKLQTLADKLALIEGIKDPITKVVELQNTGLTAKQLAQLSADWDYYLKLDPSTRKEAIQTFTMITDAVMNFKDDDARKQWAAQYARNEALIAGDEGSTEYKQKYKITYELALTGDVEKVGSLLTQAKYGIPKLLDPKSTGKVPPEEEGSKVKKEDPYKFLLERLKNVRNAAINAAGGLAELNKALAVGNSKSVQNRFRGVEQQLNAQGRNRQFIDFAMSQDPAEQKKYFTTAGSKIKSGKNKGRISDPFRKGKLLPKTAQSGDVVLSDLGEKYNKAFDAAVVGEFNAAAGRSLSLIKEQEVVRRKLVAAGYDAVSIENILADEYTTSAIYSKKITEQELRTNAELSTQLTNRRKINNLIAKGTEALNRQKDVSKIPALVQFLKAQGVGADSLRDIIGDPESLSDAIAAMEDYKNGSAGAAENLKSIVAGLLAIKQNSNIQIAIDFVTKDLAGQVQAGAEGARTYLDAKRKTYSYLNSSELTSATSSYQDPNKAPQPVGQIAAANVAARYKAAGVSIPDIPAGATISSIGKQRADLGKTIDIASSNLQSIQNRIANANNTLQSALDNVNSSFDAAVKSIQDGIKKYENDIKSIEKTIKAKEDEIKTRFTDKIEAFNKENQMLSNDLTIMDKAAEDINEKYDKQVEALQEVNDLNQQIIDSQGQQLDLADALSKGDISAAAKIAQDMRASAANSQADTIMQGIELSRTNDLSALKGAESGLTRDEISERQFAIGQAIYKLETDPARIAIETEILRLRESILDIEKNIAIEQDKIQVQEDLRATALAAAEASHKQIVADLQAQEKTQSAILTTLTAEDEKLKSQEDYLNAIANEAIEVDETTGMTLEKWQETEDKVLNIKKLAEDYAVAVEAAAAAAAAGATSWANILESINKVPSSVSTKVIVDEIRRITSVFINDPSSEAAANAANAKTLTAQQQAAAIAAALRKLTSGQTLSAAESALLSISRDAQGDDPNAYKSAIEALHAAEAAAKAADAAKAAAEAAAKAAESKQSNSTVAGSGTNVMAYEANGGFIPKGTDTVPAMLTPGEYVVRRSAVEKYGTEFLENVNTQRFAEGGVVKPRRTLGGSGANKNKAGQTGLRALFNPEIWESTANFFGLPEMGKTAQDLAKYGPVGLPFARAFGMETKSTFGDNLTAALNVVPLPLAKIIKPSLRGISANFKKINEFVKGKIPKIGPKPIPGSVSEESLEIGKILGRDETGINTTVRATLDGVSGFYKPGIGYDEVRREVFGSLFASKSKLISPKNIPITTQGGKLADGIFSPDVSDQGAETLKSLMAKSHKNPNKRVPEFDRVKNPSVAASSGYQNAVMAALRYVDGHDANLVINPETLKPGLIDFGRILDYYTVNNADRLAKEIAKPLRYLDNAGKDKLVSDSYFSGVENGVEVLSKLKKSDIKKMLMESGYTGKELKEKLKYMLTSIDNTISAAPIAKANREMANPLVPGGLNSFDPQEIIEDFTMPGFYTLMGRTKKSSESLPTPKNVTNNSKKFDIAGLLAKPALAIKNIREAKDFVHYAHRPIEMLQPSIGKVTPGMAQYGPGTYGSTTDKFMGDTFGTEAHKLSLSPLAWIKTALGKGSIDDTQLAVEAAKIGIEPGATITDDFAKILKGKGYSGYKTDDIITNWNVGDPGFGLKNSQGKVPFGKIASPAPAPKIGKFDPTLLMSRGGMVPKYFAAGGYAMGTDTVPAMLTPGEFVMSKYAVEKYGIENMKSINSGSSVGDSVYNYNLNLNVKSDANPDDIARAVMVQIKSVDAQRIRGARF